VLRALALFSSSSSSREIRTYRTQVFPLVAQPVKVMVLGCCWAKNSLLTILMLMSKEGEAAQGQGEAGGGQRAVTLVPLSTRPEVGEGGEPEGEFSLT
jgi:hypothetical protein